MSRRDKRGAAAEQAIGASEYVAPDQDAEAALPPLPPLDALDVDEPLPVNGPCCSFCFAALDAAAQFCGPCEKLRADLLVGAREHAAAGAASKTTLAAGQLAAAAQAVLALAAMNG